MYTHSYYTRTVFRSTLHITETIACELMYGTDTVSLDVNVIDRLSYATQTSNPESWLRAAALCRRLSHSRSPRRRRRRRRHPRRRARAAAWTRTLRASTGGSRTSTCSTRSTRSRKSTACRSLSRRTCVSRAVQYRVLYTCSCSEFSVSIGLERAVAHYCTDRPAPAPAPERIASSARAGRHRRARVRDVELLGLHVVRRAASRRAARAPGVRLAERLARAVPALLSGRARAHRCGCA